MKAPVISSTGESWVRLRRFVEQRIDKLRDDLEQPGIGEDVRGEIRGLRWLIAQVEPALPEDRETGDDRTKSSTDPLLMDTRNHDTRRADQSRSARARGE